MSRYQHGHAQEAFSAFHVQHYQTELRDGQWIHVRRSHRLCARIEFIIRARQSGTSKAVQKLRADFMTTVNEDVVGGEDMPIADFWTKYLHYLHYCWRRIGQRLW
jgi:hypothetical protein